jgi:4-hydroxy-tetrahydrodipicolinate synthase
MKPMLDIDVSARLVQNIKLAEMIAIGSNDRCRAPRLPLIGEERARIAAIVEEGIRRRPKLPALTGVAA